MKGVNFVNILLTKGSEKFTFVNKITQQLSMPLLQVKCSVDPQKMRLGNHTKLHLSVESVEWAAAI